MKRKTRKSNNLVAKHARKFNKAAVHRDRTKYKRSKRIKEDEWEP